MNVPTITEEAATDLLLWLRSTAESAEEFVVTQTPLVAQEYVSWYMWSRLIPIILLLLIATTITLGVYGILRAELKKLNKNAHNYEYQHASMWANSVIAWMVTWAITLCICIPLGIYTAKAIVAPRVIILQWILDNLR